MKSLKILSIRFALLSLTALTSCLDTDGSVESGSVTQSPARVTAGEIEAGTLQPNVLINNVSQLPAPMNGSLCGANQILQWNGTGWTCIDTPSVSGAPATSVPASGITSGAIGGGVTFPTNQLMGQLDPELQLSGDSCTNNQILQWSGTEWGCVDIPSGGTASNVPAAGINPGTIGAGVLLPVNQIMGQINPSVQLGDNGCSANQILEWSGTQWSCVNQSTGGPATSVPASGITPGTIGAGVLLPANQLNGSIDPLAQLSGSTCAPNQIMQWDGANWNCINIPSGGPATSVPASGITPGTIGAGVLLPANQLNGSIDPLAQLSGSTCTANQIMQWDGANWNCINIPSGGPATSVPASGITPGTIGAGVLLPANQLNGSINYATQLSGAGCTANQIMQWDGANWTCIDVPSGAPSNNSVNSSTIVDNSVTSIDIENGGVNLIDLSTDSVDSSKILNGSITGIDISNRSIDATTKLSTTCSNGQFLSATSGNVTCANPPSGGSNDNLGNHRASQNLDLRSYRLVGNGGNEGIEILNSGAIGLGIEPPNSAWRLSVSNTGDLTQGRTTMGSSYMALGAERTSIGSAGINFHGDTDLNHKASIQKLSGAGGDFVLKNNEEGNFVIQNHNGFFQVETDLGERSFRIDENGIASFGGLPPDNSWRLFIRDSASNGSAGIGSAFMALGYDRSSDGASGISFVTDNNGGDATIYKASSTNGNLIFDNSGGSGDFKFSTSASFNTVSMNSNGRVGILTGNPGYTLHVNGSAGKPGGGSWSNASDRRLKDIHGEYKKGLEDILKLRPVEFSYKRNNDRGLPYEPVYRGFIAQEVDEVFDEAVDKGEDGFFDFNMHSINVAFVNAFKDLNSKVISFYEKLKEDISSIFKILNAHERRQDDLEKRVKKLEEMNETLLKELSALRDEKSTED